MRKSTFLRLWTRTPRTVMLSLSVRFPDTTINGSLYKKGGGLRHTGHLSSWLRTAGRLSATTFRCDDGAQRRGRSQNAESYDPGTTSPSAAILMEIQRPNRELHNSLNSLSGSG